MALVEIIRTTKVQINAIYASINGDDASVTDITLSESEAKELRDALNANEALGAPALLSPDAPPNVQPASVPAVPAAEPAKFSDLAQQTSVDAWFEDGSLAVTAPASVEVVDPAASVLEVGVSRHSVAPEPATVEPSGGRPTAPTANILCDEVHEVLLLLAERQGKLAAIKCIRELTGYGLKEAKDWIEHEMGLYLRTFAT